MSLNTQTDRLRSFTMSFVSRFLAVFILSSFAVTLLPIANTSAESMPCCAGKSAEHCDSGLMAPKPPPVVPKEPMCGLHSTPTSNAVKTVVNDPLAVESVSVEQECQMDCGACATAPLRPKPKKSLIQPRATHHAPSTITTAFDATSSFYSSNENWRRIPPRGPPSLT